MPPLLAVGFIVVQQAVFGLLLGGSFAPNHKGMPIVPKNAKVDFLRRQVLMSRNIRGGLLTDFMMGGLNYQIEHHLFPSMPRPNLRKVQPMVREHCAKHGISYTETSLVGLVPDRRPVPEPGRHRRARPVHLPAGGRCPQLSQDHPAPGPVSPLRGRARPRPG